MSEDSVVGVPVSKDPRECVHGVALDDFCYHCVEIEMEEEEEAAQLHDEDQDKIQILLAHAPLTGCERAHLEILVEDDEFKRIDRERFQQIVNQHVSVLHQHQK